MADATKQMERELIAQKVANIAGKASSISATSSASSILSAIADIKGNPNLSPSDLAMLSQVETQLLAEEKNKMIAAQAEIAEYFKQDMLNRAGQLAEGIKELKNKVDDFNKKFEEDEKKLDENRKRREENNKIIDENPRSEEAKKARDENIKSLADDCGLVAQNMEQLEKLDAELQQKKEAVDKMFGNTKDENLSPEMRKLKKEMLEEIADVDKMLAAPRDKLVKHQKEITNELAELLIRDRVIEENRDVPADKLKTLLKDAIAKGPTREEFEHARKFMQEELKDGVSPKERHERFQNFVDDFASNKGFSKNSAENTQKIESQTHENGKEEKKLWANRVNKKEFTPEKSENISR